MRVGRSVRVRWGDVEAMMRPTGARGWRVAPSADARGFWEGEYVPLVGLSSYGDS